MIEDSTFTNHDNCRCDQGALAASLCTAQIADHTSVHQTQESRGSRRHPPTPGFRTINAEFDEAEASARFYWLIQRQLQPGGARQELTRQDSTRCGVFVFQLGFLHYTNTSCIIVCWSDYRKPPSACSCALCSCQCKCEWRCGFKEAVLFSGTPSFRLGDLFVRFM